MPSPIRFRLILILLLAAATAPGRVGAAQTQQPPNPAPAAAADWANAMALPAVADKSPDPRVLEIDLTARVANVEISAGRSIEAWTYNGGLPGPLIRLKVGDRLIVHFRNELPVPTTVHWHGLRIPIQMDGVPGASQPEVPTGGTFTYEFVVPDAGLFWYHPHVMSAAQVGYGLYGALLVDDPAEGFSVPDEHVLVLSDIDVTDKGMLEDPETGGSAGMAFGREGNVLLVNGRNHPRVTVPTGVPQRWRVVNTAKSRYFELDGGKGTRFIKIGGDGGLQEYSEQLDYLVLAPGERADVFYVPNGAPGTEYGVIARLFDRGYGSTEARQNEALFTLVMSGTPAPPPVTLPTVTRTIAPTPQEGARAVAIEFGIAQASDTKAFLYTINGMPLQEIPVLKASVGETQIWTVNNTTPWSHPLHLHGFFFQVLDKNGQPKRPMQWKDTVSVPYKDSLKVIVKFDDRPGAWMYHCHILDHAEGGLMSSVVVTRPGEPEPPLPHEHTHTMPERK